MLRTATRMRPRWLAFGLAALVAVLLVGGSAGRATAQPGGNGIGPARPRSASPSVSALTATPIDGKWQEFLFGGAGSFAVDCAGGCVPSSGGNSQDAGSPPYTFTAGSLGADVTVQDAFQIGDEFELFDNNVSLGVTSAAPNTGSCGDDPVPCGATAASKRTYHVGPGTHSLTIKVTDSPFGGGAAYFIVRSTKVTATFLNSAAYQFGAWNVGQCSGVNSINIRNEGTETLIGATVSITGPDAGDFILVSPAAIPNLGPQQTYAILVKFCPTAGGTRNATLTVSGGNLATPSTIGLTGTGKFQSTTISKPLSGAQEVPGPGDPDGTGNVVVTLDPTNSQICYNITVQNIVLPATAAHIHQGAAGVAGPVVVNFNPPAAWGGSNGCVAVAQSLILQIQANPAGFYVNVHNTPFPGGAVRGQLG